VGFHLTNTANGVVFDIRADHHPCEYPGGQRNNGFLVLDRNGNGIIDDGSDYLGIVTPPTPIRPPQWLPGRQSTTSRKLAHGDGVIDERDRHLQFAAYMDGRNP